jgi:hypothetical protein
MRSERQKKSPFENRSLRSSNTFSVVSNQSTLCVIGYETDLKIHDNTMLLHLDQILKDFSAFSGTMIEPSLNPSLFLEIKAILMARDQL